VPAPALQRTPRNSDKTGAPSIAVDGGAKAGIRAELLDTHTVVGATARARGPGWRDFSTRLASRALVSRSNAAARALPTRLDDAENAPARAADDLASMRMNLLRVPRAGRAPAAKLPLSSCSAAPAHPATLIGAEKVEEIAASPHRPTPTWSSSITT